MRLRVFMLLAAYGAGCFVCFLPELAYLISLGLHIVILSFSSVLRRPVCSAINISSGTRVFFRSRTFYLHSFPSPTVTHQHEMGRKRASPGVDTEKNPFGDVELSEAHGEKLEKICEEAKRVDIFLGTRRPPPTYIALYLMPYRAPVEFLSLERFDPFLLKRREILKSIPRFWPVALSNHPSVSIYAVHHQDQVALSYLEDVWLGRDPKEKRCFTLEFVRRSRLSRNPSRGAHMQSCSTSRRTHSSPTLP